MKNEKYRKLIDEYIDLIEIIKEKYPDDYEIDLVIRSLQYDLQLFRKEKNEKLYNIIVENYKNMKETLGLS